MKVLVRCGKGENRLIDDERHKELMRDGYRPVSGKAESVIIGAILKLRGGCEIYRRLKCDRGDVFVRTKHGKFTVVGNDQVLYVRPFEG